MKESRVRPCYPSSLYIGRNEAEAATKLDPTNPMGPKLVKQKKLTKPIKSSLYSIAVNLSPSMVSGLFLQRSHQNEAEAEAEQSRSRTKPKLALFLQVGSGSFEAFN